MATMKHFLDNDGLLYLWSKIKSLVGTKVDKVEGKGLSTNDYTNEEKAKLEELKNYTLEAATAEKLGGVKVGDGIQVAADGTISAKHFELEAATEEKLGGIKVGSGLTMGEDGKLNAEGYTLPAATDTTLGGVKIGAGLNVTDGTATLAAATAEKLGGVIVGEGLTIGDDGKLNAAAYTLPTATKEKVGGVKVGDGIEVDADGVISVTPYTLPAATAEKLGGVKVGEGITLGEDGAISVKPYTLNAATADALGGVKVGEGLTIGEDGKLAVNSEILAMDWSKIQNKPELVLKNDMVNVYRYVGSVANEAALPENTEENPITPGSVYNLESTGMNVAWTGDGWDDLGGVFKIEAMSNAEIDAIVNA